MSVRPRLSLSGRGLGASVTIGPLRITRSGRGRWSLGLALPRARARRAADLVRARDPREGAWPAPEGAPLPPSTRPAVAAERCDDPDCGHGPGFHDGNPPGTAPYTRCWARDCPCQGWIDPGPEWPAWAVDPDQVDGPREGA